MFLPVHPSRSKNLSATYIFIFIAPILFRLLYGVPPIPSEYRINVPAIPSQAESKSATEVISHQYLTISKSTQPSSENSNSKRLAPFKTFKNKIIKDKSFNPAESLDLSQTKISSSPLTLASPSQGKRYLTTHSNAPPSQK